MDAKNAFQLLPCVQVFFFLLRKIIWYWTSFCPALEQSGIIRMCLILPVPTSPSTAVQPRVKRARGVENP